MKSRNRMPPGIRSDGEARAWSNHWIDSPFVSRHSGIQETRISAWILESEAFGNE